MAETSSSLGRKEEGGNYLPAYQVYKHDFLQPAINTCELALNGCQSEYLSHLYAYPHYHQQI